METPVWLTDGLLRIAQERPQMSDVLNLKSPRASEAIFLYNIRMVLMTHVITGASVSSLVPEYPVAGFVFGLASHFILDSIPHWDYKLNSESISPEKENNFKIDKNFITDLLKIGIDFLLGLGLVYLFLKNFNLAVIFGIVGGVLPDFLWIVSKYLKCEPFTSICRFHKFVHSKKDLNSWKFWGPALQITVTFLIIFVFKLL